jgi:hypothetical protein
MGYVMNGLGGMDDPAMGSMLSKAVKSVSKAVAPIAKLVAPIATAFIPGVGPILAPVVAGALKAYNAQEAAKAVKGASQSEKEKLVANPAPAEWDEASYLAANPDVADSIRRDTGVKGTGWQHYVLHGASEGRKLRATPSEILAAATAMIGQKNRAAFQQFARTKTITSTSSPLAMVEAYRAAKAKTGSAAGGSASALPMLAIAGVALLMLSKKR